MPTGKPAIGVFYKSAGKAVDPPVCIPVKKYKYFDLVPIQPPITNSLGFASNVLYLNSWLHFGCKTLDAVFKTL
jgi:hypothetical protein